MLSTSDGHEPESLPVSVCMCCFWTEGHMTALSRKPEQSGWCLSSLYWQLLSNKEGVVFHTLRFQRFHSRVLSVSNCYNYSAGRVLWFHYIIIIMSWCSLELFIYIELRAPQTFEHQHLIKYTWSLFYVCFALVLI